MRILSSVIDAKITSAVPSGSSPVFFKPPFANVSDNSYYKTKQQQTNVIQNNTILRAAVSPYKCLHLCTLYTFQEHLCIEGCVGLSSIDPTCANKSRPYLLEDSENWNSKSSKGLKKYAKKSRTMALSSP